MKVGILKEIKVLENRVAMVPNGVISMVAHGQEVYVEASAGVGAGYSDEDYLAAGGKFCPPLPKYSKPVTW